MGDTAVMASVREPRVEYEFSSFEDELMKAMPLLTHFCRNLCRRERNPRDVSEEIIQSTVCRAWKSRHTFKKHSRLSSWLCRISLNVYRDYIRNNQRKRRYATDTIDSYPESVFASVDDSLQHETAILARQATKILHQLPEPNSAVIKLILVGHTFTEINTILGIPVSTAKTRYDAGIKRIRVQMPH